MTFGRPAAHFFAFAIALGAKTALESRTACASPSPQPPEAQTVTEARDRARALAEQGLARIDAGDVEGGLALLEQAETEFHGRSTATCGLPAAVEEVRASPIAKFA